MAQPILGAKKADWGIRSFCKGRSPYDDEGRYAFGAGTPKLASHKNFVNPVSERGFVYLAHDVHSAKHGLRGLEHRTSALGSVVWDTKGTGFGARNTIDEGGV